jgi:hypothetical protein
MMTATEETHKVPMNLLQDDEDNTLPEAEVDGSIDPDTDEELEDEDDEFEDDDEEDEDDEDEEEGDDVEEEDDEDVVDDETDDEDDEDADVPVPPTSTRL